MKEKVTYIFGHKNPDTDTICAAISLSYLKNKLGLNTIPATLGNINEETKYALKSFGIKEPVHLNDVKLQIKDVNYHRDCFIDKNVSIKDAFDYIHKYSLTGVGVVENKNKYYGYVSLKEIAKELISGKCNKLNTSYGNIIKILKGKKILKFDKEINGNIIATNYSKETNNFKLNSESVVIADDRIGVIEKAIKSKVKLIILVSNKTISKELLKVSTVSNINIISTPYSTYEVCKILTHSNYINSIIRKEEIATFYEVDYLSEFLKESKKY